MKFHFLPLVLTTGLVFASGQIFAKTGSHTKFTPSQKTAIEKIIHDYLIQNPEVLVKASQALQTKQVQQQQSQAMKAISANKLALFHDPNTPFAGNPKGDVYFVEFFDYQCGHCRTVAPAVEKIEKTDKNVKFMFKELPIFGGASKFAAKAALAAYKLQPNKYLAFHNALFSIQDILTREKVLNAARKVGLSPDDVTAEMAKPTYEAQIRANFALAQKLGIMGTPAFIISNKAQTKFQFIPGATDEQGLQDAINAVEK